jgi:NAD+ synthase
MTKALHITLAQINPIVGDVTHNLNRVRQVRDDAPENTDLIIFPETVLSGYPAEDLILKHAFIDSAMAAVLRLIHESKDGGPALLVTAPWRSDSRIYNAVHLIQNGEIKATRAKADLPNYGVFDDKRVFSPAAAPLPIDFKGHKLGVMICEDMWTPRAAASLQDHDASILIVTNASPFEKGKHAKRLRIARERAAQTGLPLIYVNQCCGQDDLVFDGGSFVLNEKGLPVFEGERFAEAIYHTTWEQTPTGHWLCAAPESVEPPENEVYQAAMLALRDYVTKNGFPGVILGMSGGIDSALSAAIAVDALGPDAVQAVMMPSGYTVQDSVEDAAACSRALGIHHDVIAIKEMVSTFEKELKPHFTADTPGVVHENIQPRCRGVILMALSNANGKMVLSTGNKSELAVGYATLYGDMCGGYNVLKDIYKTEIYALARWRNAHRPRHGFGPQGPVIPDRILTKAPTAELRPGQTDQDTLPPYDVLDGILYGLVEEDLGREALVERGYDADTVMRVWKMLDAAEYKRRQSCPGPKIGPRAFTRERRYPLVNRYLKHVENQG